MADTGTTEGRILGVVEDRRRAANLTQTSLSEITGIPLATLNRYLNGHGSLKFWHLERLAEALGTTVTAITSEAEAA